MSVFNSMVGTGVPGLFQGEDVEALAPTVNWLPEEFSADHAEVVPLMTSGVEPPLVDFPPTAVEGRVFVDRHLAGPLPIVAIPQQTWSV